MARRNDDRTGASKKDAAATPPVTETTDSPLSFVTPTEFVELPTKGRFYPKNHPLHNKETIEIRFMTAKDEDILTSRTLLKRGLAVERLLQGLIIDQNIKINDLFIGDKNALVVAARISGYGAEYNAGIACPACGEQSDFSFDLTEATKVIEGQDSVDIADDGTFTVTLPKTKANVVCRLLTGRDESALSFALEKKRKNNLPDSIVTDQIKSFIVSIHGENDRAQIARFVDLMPVLDSRHLRNTFSDIAPNVEMTQEFSCSKCAHEQEMELPFTAEFFWPNR
jgi:hypothetical protein